MAEDGDELRPKAGGEGDRLLSWARVQAITGLSRSTAYRLQREGAFPPSIAISPRRVGWWESELAAWKQTRRPGPFKPPGQARLPGTLRRARPSEPKIVEAAPSECEPLQLKPQPQPRPRRQPSVHPGQIDFGF